MIKKFCTAAVFVLLTTTAPAHAAIVWYQIDTLNLTYPNNTTLTGNLDIQDGAPQVGAYIGQASSSLNINGHPLTYVTSGSGCIYYVNPFEGITFYVPPPNAPDAPNPYGEAPLYLFASTIFLNGVPAISGTVSTDFCTVPGDFSTGPTGPATCTNAAPLPAALPLFGSAVLALAGLAWRRGKVSG